MTALLAASNNSGTTVLFIGVTVLILLFWYLATEKERRKKYLGSIIIAAISVCSLFAIISPSKLSEVISGNLPMRKATHLNGGIDLVGGTQVVLEIKPNVDPKTNELIPVNATAMNSAKETLEKRINKSGTLNAPITIVGNRLEIQIPKLAPEVADNLIKELTTAAKLSIHAVHPNSQAIGARVSAKIEELRKTDPEASAILEDGRVNPELYDIVDIGYKALPQTIRDEKTGEELGANYVIIRNKSEIASRDISEAGQNPMTPSEVYVTLTSEGGDKMLNFTKTLTPQKDFLATVLDNKIVNKAVLNADRLGKRFVISGLHEKGEAERLIKALKNPLDNDIEVMERRSVSASLGETTVNQGIKAGIAGLALTLLFVVIYYRFAGIIALIGLVVNILILFGAMAAFNASFTLPGIAGIILTIGVAVDANVLIYERMREELKLKKSVKAAISAAYEKAFSAIFDANITTLITAVILYWQASGSVKGFAVTLTIGILGTLIAALLCTRVLFAWFTDNGMLKKMNFMNLVPNRAIDFLSQRKLSFSLSAFLLIGSLVFTGIKGGDARGIDFVGGEIIRMEIPAGQAYTQPQIDKLIKDLPLSKAYNIQIEEPTAADKAYIAIKCAEEDAVKIETKIREALPGFNEKVQATDQSGKLIVNENGTPQEVFAVSANTEKVSAAMGSEFLKNSLIALAIGLFAVMIYITVRFEFSFAIGAFFALLHDIIIVLGLLVVLGQEFSLIHVGAFLTLAGYSINDTIVVFDRIRESLTSRRGEVKDIINEAISSTLSRTVLTSLTTFVAVLVLFIFGGAALKNFSLTIMLGVIVGTYSSIFIASPIVYIFSKSRGINLRRELLDANIEAEVNPAGNR